MRHIENQYERKSMHLIIRILRAAVSKSVNKSASLCALLAAVFISQSLLAQVPELDNSAKVIPTATQMLEQFTIDEAEFDAYDPRLLNRFDRWGRQLQESGEHQQALAFFKQALHIARVNNGLYHESQLEVLDSLIECEMALRNWESVNDHYAYMEHLYRRLYSVDDLRLENGLQKVVAWHVNALNVNLDGRRMEHLLQANKLFKLRLQVAQMTLTANDPKIDFLYRSIAVSERQLYRASPLNQEAFQRQRSIRRNALLADRD